MNLISRFIFRFIFFWFYYFYNFHGFTSKSLSSNRLILCSTLDFCFSRITILVLTKVFVSKSSS